jgi:hypothetical protein
MSCQQVFTAAAITDCSQAASAPTTSPTRASCSPRPECEPVERFGKALPLLKDALPGGVDQLASLEPASFVRAVLIARVFRYASSIFCICSIVRARTLATVVTLFDLVER